MKRVSRQSCSARSMDVRRLTSSRREPARRDLPLLTLIQPPIEDAAYPGVPFSIEPLSLLVIASLTPRDRFRVKIIDGMIKQDKSCLIDPQSSLVGITVTTPVRESAYRIAAEYRNRGIPVIMGGCHVTLDPDDVRGHCDCMVVGEVEDSWAKILSDFRDGALKREYRCGKAQSFDIPADRTVIPRYRMRYPFLSVVQTTRGCPNRCTFCVPAATYGSEIRHRSIASVVAEIQSVKARMKRRTFGFTEDNFFADPQYAKSLMRAIAPLGIRWAAQLRIDAVRDDELIDLMVESGCFAAFVGLESTSQAALNEAAKGCSVVEYPRLVRKLRDRGILVIGSFTIGYDCDDEAVYRDTVAFCRETEIEIPLFVTLMPYKGTELHDRLVEQGRLNARQRPGSNPLTMNFRPRGLETENAHERIADMYREYYDMNYLWRNLKQRIRHRQLGRGALFLVFYAIYFVFARRIGRGGFLEEERGRLAAACGLDGAEMAEIC